MLVERLTIAFQVALNIIKPFLDATRKKFQTFCFHSFRRYGVEHGIDRDVIRFHHLVFPICIRYCKTKFRKVTYADYLLFLENPFFLIGG